MRKVVWGVVVLLILTGVGLVIWSQKNPAEKISLTSLNNFAEEDLDQEVLSPLSKTQAIGQALQITTMRVGSYPGSTIEVVEKLAAGSNYQRYRVSYQSEGLKIYALMTIPNGQKPTAGWPVIVFNHGYIPPTQYRTTERYVAYVDALARAGYIVFRSDYRGHDQSEGEASGAYGSPGYTVDILNAVASLKQSPDADPTKIGIWGHSMGGYITVRSMVISPDIKAGVVWGGVVGDYADMLNNWRRTNNGGYTPPPLASGARRWRDLFQEEYGPPQEKHSFWDSISANAYLKDISGPLQIHHARGDDVVPWEFSQSLADDLIAAEKEHELYLYPKDDHDLSGNFGVAMQRTVAFFDRYLKGE